MTPEKIAEVKRAVLEIRDAYAEAVKTIASLRAELERTKVERDDARGLLEAARKLGFAQEAPALP